jgi:hypothetical protein
MSYIKKKAAGYARKYYQVLKEKPSRTNYKREIGSDISVQVSEELLTNAHSTLNP